MPQTASAITFDAVSSQWDDDFFSLSQNLLSVNDVNAFVNVLNQHVFTRLPLDQVHLCLISDDLPPQWFVFDETQQRTYCDAPNYALLQHTSLHYADSLAFFTDFPELKAHPAYSPLQSYTQLPLTTSNRCLGIIEFISHHGEFESEVLNKFKQLSLMIAISLEHLLERLRSFHLNGESQKDNYQLLVDVTNAVISQSNLADLSRALLLELQAKFNFGGVAILSYQPLSHSFRGSHALFLESGIHLRYLALPTKNTLSFAAMEDTIPKTVTTETLASLSKHYQYCDRFLTKDMRSACFLPLIFRNQILGVLSVSHQDVNFFERIDKILLQQVASRVAMAVNAIQSHHEMCAISDKDPSVIPLNQDSPQHQVFSDIISQSQVMNNVLDKVALVADTDCTVLIMGETGTGKELIAKAVHQLSRRNRKNMIKMNCAAVPSGLLESDLFGHERGAFTGAVSQQLGRFEQAHQGSLFLDEIGDMPLELQPKLLRVLQENEIERLGSHKVIPVDVRIIAATNADLLDMVKDKSFRSDLFYRLNVFPIRLPPLRERKEDIPLLVKHFTRMFSKKMKKNITSIPAETLEKLTQLPWLGNIRELRNVIERSVVLTRGRVLNVPLDEFTVLVPEVAEIFRELPVASSRVMDAPQSETSSTPKIASCPHNDVVSMAEALHACNGVIAGERGVAARLGLKRTTLISRMKKYGLTRANYREFLEL